jgi:hypothetical protein
MTVAQAAIPEDFVVRTFKNVNDWKHASTEEVGNANPFKRRIAELVSKSHSKFPIPAFESIVPRAAAAVPVPLVRPAAPVAAVKPVPPAKPVAADKPAHSVPAMPPPQVARKPAAPAHTVPVKAVEKPAVTSAVQALAMIEAKLAAAAVALPAPQAIISKPIEKPKNNQPKDDIPGSIRQKAIDWQCKQHALVSTVNRSQLPGCQIMAWNIIPVDLFHGDVGRFLMMACDFYGHCHANTLLLPVMPSGAQQLGLPRNPMALGSLEKSAIQRRVHFLRERVQREHASASQAISHGDFRQVFGCVERQQRYRSDLMVVVNEIAVQIIGREALVQHDQLFKDFLNR